MWANREDCNSGVAFGGNKVRKLEYLAADALANGCDTLVSIGGIQSNHTRAVTSVARQFGLHVYEGNSMAGLIGMVRAGDIPAGWRVLYAYLGGQPALSAHAHTPG